jgi:hypothetical protein
MTANELSIRQVLESAGIEFIGRERRRTRFPITKAATEKRLAAANGGAINSSEINLRNQVGIGLAHF